LGADFAQDFLKTVDFLAAQRGEFVARGFGWKVVNFHAGALQKIERVFRSSQGYAAEFERSSWNVVTGWNDVYRTLNITLKSQCPPRRYLLWKREYKISNRAFH
jgi:hypothetical protein